MQSDVVRLARRVAEIFADELPRHPIKLDEIIISKGLEAALDDLCRELGVERREESKRRRRIRAAGT